MTSFAFSNYRQNISTISPFYQFLFSRLKPTQTQSFTSRSEMCKYWRWQESFFKWTPWSPPPHRRGWQPCDWTHKLSNSICLSWHFHGDPGCTDGQRLVGKKDRAVHTVTATPSPRLSALCAESIRKPLFHVSFFFTSLSTQAHKMPTNITARPITRFWWIQCYSLETYLAWLDYLFCLSFFIYFVGTT